MDFVSRVPDSGYFFMDSSLLFVEIEPNSHNYEWRFHKASQYRISFNDKNISKSKTVS